MSSNGSSHGAVTSGTYDADCAMTYEEWKTAAKALDDYLGFDEWKETEEDSYFDYALVSRSEPHRKWSLIGPLVGEESEKNTD